MINSLPGPDKGLIDALFSGSSQEPAQAVLAENSGDAALGVVPGVASELSNATPGAQDFAKMLVQTLDQKRADSAALAAVPVAAAAKPTQQLSKEEMQAVASTSEAAAKNGMSKALPKAEKPKAPRVASSDAMVQAAAVIGNSGANVLSQGAQGPAVMKAPEPAKPLVVSNPLPRKSETVKAPQSESLLPQQAQPAPVAANMLQATALGRKPDLAGVERAKAAEAQPQVEPQQTTVLQPIVIQVPMPVAVPVAFEMSEIDNEMPMLNAARTGQMEMESPFGMKGSKPARAGFNPGYGFAEGSDFEMASAGDYGASRILEGGKGVATQDFLEGRGAGRGQLLGVDRPDPRLVGRIIGEKSKGESFNGNFAESSSLVPQQQGPSSVILPHLQSIGTNAMEPKKVLLDSAPMPLASHGKVEVANPYAMAMQVQKLANDGGGVVRIKADPENLGEITISVQHERGQKLNVRFDSANAEARELISSSMNELKRSLAASQYELGKVEIVDTKSTLSSFESARSGGLMSSVGPSSIIDSSQFSGNSWNSNDSQQRDTGRDGAWQRYYDRQENQEQRNGGRQEAFRRYAQAELGA